MSCWTPNSKLASNSSHESHTDCKKRADIVDRKPILFLKFVGIATFGFVRSVIVDTMVGVGKVMTAVACDSFDMGCTVLLCIRVRAEAYMLFLVHDEVRSNSSSNKNPGMMR